MKALTFSFKTYTWFLDGLELKVGERIWIRREGELWIEGTFNLDRSRGYYIALVNEDVFLCQGLELERRIQTPLPKDVDVW